MAMMLTVTEAAQLLGQSPRTVRARLARGDLPGRKRGGQWIVPRDKLPLPESMHRELQQRAQRIRDVVEEALPSRVSSRRKRRSVVDEAAFRALHALRADMKAHDYAVAGAAACLERAMSLVAEGVHAWAPERKIVRFNDARAEVSRAVAQLMCHATLPPGAPIRGWVEALEGRRRPRREACEPWW